MATKIMAPWEALLTDKEGLSSLSQEAATAKRDELRRVLASIDEAEARRQAVAAKNLGTMRDLQQRLKAAESAEGRAAEAERSRTRGLLLQGSRLSTQLFGYATTLRQQKAEVGARLSTFDALLVYRRSAQNAFVLRHTAVHEEDGGGLVLSDGTNAGSLSKFTVVEGLGKGSFGAVFLVEHTFPAQGGGSSAVGGGGGGDDDDEFAEADDVRGPGGAAAAQRGRKDSGGEKRVLAVKMVARETVRCPPLPVAWPRAAFEPLPAPCFAASKRSAASAAPAPE